MKTLEETTVDKSNFIPGPWTEESDKKQWRDESTGLPCLIVRHPNLGHLCGYVGVTYKHPAFQKDCDALEIQCIQCHGGLTYSGLCQGEICHKVDPGEDDRVWWLGFDCGHSWDLSPFVSMYLGLSEGSYKDFGYVTRECQRLAKQLKDMEL